MTRFVAPAPTELDGCERALYDDIVTGPRAAAGATLVDSDGRLAGPFGPMLLNPTVGDLLQGTGLACQRSWSQEPALRELVILSVAACRGCEYEWNAHVARAHGLGVPAQHIAAVREGLTDPGMDAHTRAALVLVQALLHHEPIDDIGYAELAELIGPKAAFEIVALVGYYETLANIFRVFSSESQPG